MTSEIKLNQITTKQQLTKLLTATQNVETLSVDDVDSQNIMDLNKKINEINDTYKDVLDTYKNQLQLHLQEMEMSVEALVETDEVLSHKLKENVTLERT